MPDEDGKPTPFEVRDACLELLAKIEAEQREERRTLRCAECGAVDDGERGWTLRLDVDDELWAFCPDCDREEFGDGS